MGQSKSSAGRMRRLRDRKRCGTVVIQDLELKRTGVETLIARGLLDAEAADDPAKVRTALVKMINQQLTPARPFRQALSFISMGLL
jgi:hypothetical protein